MWGGVNQFYHPITHFQPSQDIIIFYCSITKYNIRCGWSGSVFEMIYPCTSQSKRYWSSNNNKNKDVSYMSIKINKRIVTLWCVDEWPTRFIVTALIRNLPVWTIKLFLSFLYVDKLHHTSAKWFTPYHP